MGKELIRNVFVSGFETCCYICTNDFGKLLKGGRYDGRKNKCHMAGYFLRTMS